MSELRRSDIETDLKERLIYLVTNRWNEPEYQDDALDALLALIHGSDAVTAKQPLSIRPPADLGLGGAIEQISIHDTYRAPQNLVTGDWPIVGAGFSPQDFANYVWAVRHHHRYKWNPSGITVHHTGVPNLAQRPNGFSAQHMKNLRHYYRNVKGWSAGPHIFVDDKRIWVLTPLNRPGIHAVSYNRTRYGIEILGNYNSAAERDSPRGQAAIALGQFAAACLVAFAGISEGRINFHRHDPETRKRCPGSAIDFTEFEAGALAMVAQLRLATP